MRLSRKLIGACGATDGFWHRAKYCCDTSLCSCHSGSAARQSLIGLTATCSSYLQVDAGIAQDLVFGDPKAPRFVFWNKKLRPTPSGPDVLTFDLLSIWGKIRAGLGAAGIKKALPGQPRSLARQQYVSCCATPASAWALQALGTTEAYATPLLDGDVAEEVLNAEHGKLMRQSKGSTSQ